MKYLCLKVYPLFLRILARENSSSFCIKFHHKLRIFKIYITRNYIYFNIMFIDSININYFFMINYYK